MLDILVNAEILCFDESLDATLEGNMRIFYQYYYLLKNVLLCKLFLAISFLNTSKETDMVATNVLFNL